MSSDTAPSEFETDTDQGFKSAVPYKYRSALYRGSLVASAVAIVVAMAFPMYWMLQNAFKNREAIQAGWSLFPTPSELTLANFEVVATQKVSTYLMNSIIVTVGTIILVVAVSLVAGYGLARFDFRGKVGFARFLLLGYMFSPIVLALPLYLIWRTLGLLNTHLGLILALAAISMPLSVWLMWKYIQALPESLEERAWVEGAPRWRGFVDIIVPQAKPAMVAVSLFAFAVAWNNFTFAQILLPSDAKTTFPPGLLRLINSSLSTGYGEFMAVSLLITAPPLLFAYFLQSYLLKGFEVRAL